MSATSIVMPGGFCAIAVRNAAMLYEPLRRLPHMARTLVPLASLILDLRGDHDGRAACLNAALGREQGSSAIVAEVSIGRGTNLLRRAHLLELDQQQDVVRPLDHAADQ